MAPPRLSGFALTLVTSSLLLGILAATAHRAAAQEVAEDPRLSAPDRLDRTSYEDDPEDEDGLWISVLAQGRAVDQEKIDAPVPDRDRSSFSAGVVVGGSFEALGGSRTAVAMPAEARREERPTREPPTRVDAALARGAFRAALARDGDAAIEERLDSLSTRSRTSASLPELRLRAMRVIDEDQALSPTAYDPSRTTASGGTSTWLEARATWRLDRWVFTREEIAVEKMRMARVRARRALEHDVLEALARWQRARWTSLDPEAPAERVLTAELEASAAEATLDVLTDGWFGRELARRAR